jgi:hypothetical protein
MGEGFPKVSLTLSTSLLTLDNLEDPEPLLPEFGSLFDGVSTLPGLILGSAGIVFRFFFRRGWTGQSGPQLYDRLNPNGDVFVSMY